MIRKITKSNIRPEKFIINKFNYNTFEINLNENIKEFEITLMDLDGQNKEIEYVYDITSKVVKAETFNELKGHIVRLKYTIEEEFSFIYKDNSDPKFVEYRAFVEEVKSFVDGWVVENERN